jgi:hypothetical protein
MTEIKRVILLMLKKNFPTDSVHEIYIRLIFVTLDPYSEIQKRAEHLTTHNSSIYTFSCQGCNSLEKPGDHS